MSDQVDRTVLPIRFHVTAMCSPTRAALLTGRNHHAVGMVDGRGAKQLKTALAEAQAGMGG